MENTIDKNSPIPLYVQLEKILREKIATSLAVGEPLGTIDEIAKTYGVSAITVKGTLYRLTDAGIVKSIKSKGYFVAKAPQVETINKIIGFSTFIAERSIINPMYVKIFEGANYALRETGMNLTLYSSEETMSHEVNNNPNFYGFLLTGLRNTALYETLYSHNNRFVLVDIQSDFYPSVLTDNKLGARMAMEYLIKLGHRDIAIINGNQDDENFTTRFEVYLEVLKENKIRDRKDFVLNDFRTPLNEKKAALKKMLTGTSRPTAIFFSSDTLAARYMPEIVKMGLKIPEDLSVIGFDDLELAFYMEPQLTTIKQPMFEVGRKAVQMLLAMENKNMAEYSGKSVFVPPQLIIRNSCKAI